MLIYEKKVKEPLKILESPVFEGESATSAKTKPRNFSELYQTIPSHIYQAILRDNQSFLFEKNLYSPEFFEFLLEFMKNGKDLMDISKICIQFKLDLIAHSYHNKTMTGLVNVLKECFKLYPNSGQEFLEFLIKDNMETLTNYLLVCPDKVTRESFASILSISLSFSAEKEFSEGSSARIIIDNLVSLIPQEITKHAIRFENYWQVFASLTQSKQISLYLLNKKIVSLLIDYYLGTNSPLVKNDEKRETIGNKL